MMDRLLCATVLRVLYLEWGNPRCYVPVLRALIGDCIFRSTKNNPQGSDKKNEKYWNRYQREEMQCTSLTAYILYFVATLIQNLFHAVL